MTIEGWIIFATFAVLIVVAGLAGVICSQIGAVRILSGVAAGILVIVLPPEFPKDYDVAPEDPSGPVAGETGPTAVPSEKASPAPAPAPKPDAIPAPAPTTSNAPSLEDIRAKGIEAAKKYGQPAIKAILKELGAENMTALPADKRAAFLAKLEGLGEGNA